MNGCSVILIPLNKIARQKSSADEMQNGEEKLLNGAGLDTGGFSNRGTTFA